MSKNENMLMQKSQAISEPLDDNDLAKVTGGDKAGTKQTSPKESISLSYGSIKWEYTSQ
jgi:bacteriocin-like protein